MSTGPQESSGESQDSKAGSLTPCFLGLLSCSAHRGSRLGIRPSATCTTPPGGRGTRSALQLRSRCWLVSRGMMGADVGPSRPESLTSPLPHLAAPLQGPNQSVASLWTVPGILGTVAQTGPQGPRSLEGVLGSTANVPGDPWNGIPSSSTSSPAGVFSAYQPV